MKRSCILSLTFILCSFAAFSQATITVSDPYPVIDGYKHYFAQKGEILEVTEGRRDLTLRKMSAKTLQVLNTQNYADFPKGFWVHSVRKVKGRYYLLYVAMQGKTTRELFVREMDFATGTFIGSSRKILTIDEPLADYGMSSFFSYDSSLMLIRYRLMPEKKRDAVSHDVLGLHVFDENFQEKWANKVTMPYTEKKMDFLSYEIDGAGNVYIAARVFNDNTTDLKNDNDEANYKIEVLKIAGTGTITSTKVEVADIFIKTIVLYETAQGKIIGTGLYNKGNTDAGVDGIVLMKFRGDGVQPEIKTYEISLEIIDQYASAKAKRKNQKDEDDHGAELNDLKLRGALIQPDGGLIVVGEQLYSVTHERYLNGKYSSFTVTFYNDMLVTKIDANGSLAWMQKLPKRQMSSITELGLGYRYVNNRGSHFFLFLDNEKNKALATTDEPETHVADHGGFLTAYKLNDQTGAVKKLSLLNVRDVQGTELFKFNPVRMVTAGPDTWVFEAYVKNKKDAMVKVVLDK